MNIALLLAAGKGKRLRSSDKMLVPVCGYPLIYYSLMAYNDHSLVDKIILVANRDNKKQLEKITKTYKFKKVIKIIEGGSSRHSSFVKGLKAIPKDTDIVITHNGANPLPSADEIFECVEQAKKHGACIVGHPVNSTIKEINGQHIIKTHDREKLFSAETPQAAKYDLLKKALTHTKKSKQEFTDEAMLLESIGHKVKYISASENNFKITTQADLTHLKAILGEQPDDYRVGIGQDSHLFDHSKKGLTLAGIKLPKEPKLEANSDGDVILHAIFNALSQAIGGKSLGFYADEMCEKGIKDSRKYLELIVKHVQKEGLQMNSLGLMIECKNPQIDPLTSQMKKSLSVLLTLPQARIGITATSGENATVFGQGLGIQCFAIVSLKAIH